MTEHILKCWPNSYYAICTGKKRFDWRKDDRGFEVDDVLVLQLWDPGPREHRPHGGYVWKGADFTTFPLTPNPYEQRAQVTYIQRGIFGIPDGYCIMSLELLPAP